MIISHQKDVGGPKLKRIKFFDTDLTSVSPEVMVVAIQRLEKVVFYRYRMTEEQITAVLNMLKLNQQARLNNAVRIKFSPQRIRIL